MQKDTNLKSVIENLEECLQEISSVDATVRELLSFTRQPRKPNQEEVDFELAVSRTFSVLEPDANEARVCLRFHPPVNDAKLIACQQEIEELLYLLIDNAIKAAPGNRPAEIEVSLSEGASFTCITIKDTCSGISQENQSEIFDMFFTTKPRGKGTGLGLNIAKQIVENFDGSIHVESEEGKGSLFTLEFPKKLLSKEFSPEEVRSPL